LFVRTTLPVGTGLSADPSFDTPSNGSLATRHTHQEIGVGTINQDFDVSTTPRRSTMGALSSVASISTRATILA
jgi:hypothetical protein